MNMLHSSTPPRSAWADHASRSGTPNGAVTPPRSDLQETSDVACYTCRRRHVRCDRMLPACAKCRKKGVQCLGYTKPLRWADGVAVRGKLKGKSKPVLDGHVGNVVKESVQNHVNITWKEAPHGNISSPTNFYEDVVGDENRFLELLAYHNSTICAEQFASEQSTFIDRKIAPLTQEMARRLPRSIVNCILGIAAVHMASRSPGNRVLERLALETKVNVYQSQNRLLQMPQHGVDLRPDVVICSGILIFAMDLIEYGMSRWMIHTLGQSNIVSKLGGFEHLSSYYPNLHVPFFYISHFETMWIISSYIPVTKPKQASRRALEMLCRSPHTVTKVFNPCPLPLTLALWDIGACAQTIVESSTPITFTEMHKREQVLFDVLSFQPRDSAQALGNEYLDHSQCAGADRRAWELMYSAWKAAVTILTLRYLYFGRPNLAPYSRERRSPTPSLGTQLNPYPLTGRQGELGSWFHSTEEFDRNDFVDESTDVDSIPDLDYLTAGNYYGNPISRSPSPLASPMHYTEPPSSDAWSTRYYTHDEAFTTLFESLSTLNEELGVHIARYVHTPMLVLALVSRPGSRERELCSTFFVEFEASMNDSSPGSRDPKALAVEIPWEKLDEYSEAVELLRQDSAILPERPMAQSAPEWNWWDMLKHIDMNMSWPVTCGTSHVERGSDFWAFGLMSSIVNEESLNSWLQGPT